LASCTSISWSQQVSLPSPALVQSASVPHFPQRYLLPSWLATLIPPVPNRVVLFFLLHRLAATGDSTVASLGDYHLSTALGASISFTYLICHTRTTFLRAFFINIIVYSLDIVKAKSDWFYLFTVVFTGSPPLSPSQTGIFTGFDFYYV